MLFSVSARELADGFKLVDGLLAKEGGHNRFAPLVQFQVRDSGVSVRGGDYDSFVDLDLDVTVGADVSSDHPVFVLVDRVWLRQVLKGIGSRKNDTVVFYTDRVKHLGFTYDVPGVEAEVVEDAREFLANGSASGAGGWDYSVATDELLRAIEGVHLSVGADPMLPVLTCFQLRGEYRGAFLEGTDRFRLAEGFMPSWAGGEAKFLLPGKKLVNVAKFFDGETVELMPDGDRVWLRCGKLTVGLREQEGSYPVMESLWPSDLEGFTIDRKELLAQVTRLKRSLVLRQSGGDPDRVTVRVEDGRLWLSTVKAKAPATRVDLTGERDTGFNIRFLEDTLKSLDEDVITVSIPEDGSKPAVFEVEGLRVLLMPRKPVS